MTAFLAALFASFPVRLLVFAAAVVLVKRGVDLACGLVKPVARAVRPAWLRLQVAALLLFGGRGLVYLAADYRAPEPEAAPLRRHAVAGRCGPCEEQMQAALRLPAPPSGCWVEVTWHPEKKLARVPPVTVEDLRDLPNPPLPEGFVPPWGGLSAPPGDWPTWRLVCGHKARGPADVEPIRNRLLCPEHEAASVVTGKALTP